MSRTMEIEAVDLMWTREDDRLLVALRVATSGEPSRSIYSFWAPFVITRFWSFLHAEKTAIN